MPTTNTRQIDAVTNTQEQPPIISGRLLVLQQSQVRCLRGTVAPNPEAERARREAELDAEAAREEAAYAAELDLIRRHWREVARFALLRADNLAEWQREFCRSLVARKGEGISNKQARVLWWIDDLTWGRP